MEKLNLSGLGVALVTPFKKDKTIDFEALKKVVDHIINQGADYIVVMGTTGETPTLSSSEKNEIKWFVKNYVDGRVPLILGFGGNSTFGLIEELRTTDFEGYSAILSVAPFYNKPNQEGLYQHFKEIAKASPLPIILYNVPGRTGVNISADTTLRLSDEFRNIIAIKEASGNFEQAEKILQNKRDDFVVLSGDDGYTLRLMQMGASGVISVIGNALPLEFGKMVSLCRNGKFDEAAKLDECFSELYSLMFADGNPAGVKCALKELNLIENELRLPLVSARKEIEDSIAIELKRFKEKVN